MSVVYRIQQIEVKALLKMIMETYHQEQKLRNESRLDDAEEMVQYRMSLIRKRTSICKEIVLNNK